MKAIAKDGSVVEWQEATEAEILPGGFSALWAYGSNSYNNSPTRKLVAVVNLSEYRILQVSLTEPIFAPAHA